MSYAEYFREVSKGLELVYENGLDGLRHHPDNKENLTRMSEALNELSCIERRKNLHLLWWFGSAFMESLHDGGIIVSEATLDLCNQFRDLIHLISKGDFVDRDNSDLQSMLDMLRLEIKDSRSNGVQVREVKTFISQPPA